jgi:HlyD family secretion protein
MNKTFESARAGLKRAFDFANAHRRISIPVGVVLLLVLIWAVSRGSAQPRTQYQTVAIERGELTATVGATGTVRARQSAVLAWQSAGTVDQVRVDVGERVSQGDVLATLASTSVPQSIILAQADLVEAQRALDDLLHSDTERAQALIAVNDAQDALDEAQSYRDSLNGKLDLKKITYITIAGHQIPQVKYYKGYADPETIADADAKLALATAQLEDAQRTYDRLKDGPNKDDIAAARARVDAAQATLNMARVLAPFNGTVTQAEPLPGDQVTAGTVAFRVDNLSELLVDVDVSEVDVNSIAVGQPVTLSFDAILDQDYHGQVTEVAQAGDVVSGVVNFTVTVKLTDADQRVKPGMTAAVNIVVQEIADQLLVPNRAVRLQDGKHVVYVLRGGGQPQVVEVTLGPSSDTMSVVLAGLSAGDQVVLNPPAQFQGPGGGPRGGFGGP